MGLLRRRVSGVNDDTVRDATGWNWAEWGRILDRAGARMMDHAELAAYLRDQHQLTAWWAQKVSTGYEQERGVRKKYQRGYRYSVNRTKTVAAPVSAIWDAWVNQAILARWLPGIQFRVSSSTPHKIMHLRCSDGTKIDVTFQERVRKTRMVVCHDRLAEPADAERLNSYWAGALDRLQEILEG
jgi:hypothetical protein